MRAASEKRASEAIDPQTWRMLVESANCASLLAVIRSRMGNGLKARMEPEDVLQESLLQAWRDRGAASFASARAFRAWLLTIIDHRLRDIAEHVQAKKRGGAAGEFNGVAWFEPSGSTTPSRMASHREQAAAMLDALEGVPGEYRPVVQLRLFQQRTLHQIAEELGLTLAIVRSRLRRGAEIYRLRLRAAGIGRSTLRSRDQSAHPRANPASP